MISKIYPAMPVINSNPEMSVKTAVIGIVLLAATALIAFCLSRYAAKKYVGDKNKTAVVFTVLSFIVTLALLCFFGVSAVTIKGIVFCLILILSSYSDIKSWKCDDYLHLMIVIAAFIGIDLKDIPSMFGISVFVIGLMLSTVIFTKSRFGGADIKLSTASVFLLGAKRGLTGLIIGLIAAIVVNSLRPKAERNKRFPMVPYLAAGFLTAYFI